jgi:peroxiredoxin
MALTYSKGMLPGTAAPDFSLRGVDGKMYSLLSFQEAAVLVIVFTCNHCPYAVASEDRLIALQNEFSDRGVRFVLINPNDAIRYPEDSFENMSIRSREKSFPFPYLQDESQETARNYDAVCTPDPFVFSRHRRLYYNGRIDDNWKEPEHAIHHDLRTAIRDCLDDRTLTIEQIPSMGCSIKWK